MGGYSVTEVLISYFSLACHDTEIFLPYSTPKFRSYLTTPPLNYTTLMMKLLAPLFLLFLPIFMSSNALATNVDTNLYKVNSGDVLAIHVWNEDSLTHRAILVRPDGYLSAPIIGEILAGGHTIPEIQEAVADKLSTFLINDPVVTIILTEITGNTIYVVGKVNRPGQFIIRNKTDVLQAIALAGGLTSFADEGDIRILRRDADSIQRSIPFDYKHVQDGTNLDSNILLKSGDTVVVP